MRRKERREGPIEGLSGDDDIAATCVFEFYGAGTETTLLHLKWACGNLAGCCGNLKEGYDEKLHKKAYSVE
jgi:hypothetical protein